MKILVVEDEIDLNSVITKHLKKNGYSIDSAFNGEEAMDDLTFLQRQRATKLATPVLILTAKDDVDDVVKGLDAGTDDYLVKAI